MKKAIAIATGLLVVGIATPAQASESCINAVLGPVCIGTDNGISVTAPGVTLGNPAPQAAPTSSVPTPTQTPTQGSTPVPTKVAEAPAQPQTNNSIPNTANTAKPTTPPQEPAKPQTLAVPGTTSVPFPPASAKPQTTAAAPERSASSAPTTPESTTPPTSQGITTASEETTVKPESETRYVYRAFKFSLWVLLGAMFVAIAVMSLMYYLGRREGENNFNAYMLDMIKQAHSRNRRGRKHRAARG